MRLRSSPYRSYRESRTSPTVSPSTSAVDSPPVASRSWVGILTLTAIARILSGWHRRLRCDGVERVDARLDLEPLERPAGAIERLQPLAGDVGDDPLGAVDVA